MILNLLPFLVHNVGKASVIKTGYLELEVRVPREHIKLVESWLEYNRPVGIYCPVKALSRWEAENFRVVTYIEKQPTRKP